MERPWYQINDINQLDSPALVIYPERVKQNIKTLIDGIDDVGRLRPHIKTHKSAEVCELMMAAGITKFKCATIAEAELLGITKASDVLLAYQPYGPKLSRFIQLIDKYPQTTFSCLVDNLVSAEEINEQAQKHKIKLALYLDLNVGMNRTGIKPDFKALSLYEAISALPNVNLIGLHAYDGHIYETDMAKRTAQCTEIYDSVLQLKSTLEVNGYTDIKLIMGGSPSFPIYGQFKNVECSPGTFVYWDQNYLKALPEQAFLPAALVITRLISMPAPDVICLDLGHKGIASENNLFNRVKFLNAPDLEFLGHSEEHLVIKVNENHNYKIGNVFYGLPYHICPTCALYSKANLVINGQLAGKWAIEARERQIEV